MKLHKQIGFEFEIGAPDAMSTVCRKIKDELGITGLKTQADYTVITPQKYDGEIVTPTWPYRQGIANLRRIFRWFAGNGVVTNETCGFHVNLSYKRTELNWMMDPLRLILCFNEEKWLKICKREGNDYTECYMDDFIISSSRKRFVDDEQVYKWINTKIEDLTNEGKYRTVALERLEDDNPYIEYRCLGGVGYHLRPNVMLKAIIDMANNMDRALPDGRGTGFMTVKVKECFLQKSSIPH